MKGSRIANRLELRPSTEPVRESQHELERPSRPVMKRTTAMTPSSVFQLDHQSGIIAEAQPKRRRKGRKSMSRRSGQNGTVVIAGNWYRVRWRMDAEGQEKRINMSAKIAPVVFDKNGEPKLPSAEVERKAREIVEKSGANSEQHFNRVVLGEVSFRDQAKTYVRWAITRDREPIRDTSSIEAALNKWILPAIGDLPLGNVHNITVKPLVTKMKKSLSARTVNKYVEYIEQVVASLKDGKTGEPVHPRKWDAKEMDLPVLKSKEQRRPALNLNAVNKLVSESEGDEQSLYVLLAATGMRISEALALKRKHFVNNCRTIQVCQQVDRDHPRIVNYVKTDADSVKLTYARRSESTSKHSLIARTDCYSRPGTALRTCTTILNNAGLRLVSKRWESMKAEWAFTLSAVSGRLG